ncbi:MAG: DUF1707 SHOCT-like domain-containing protein [Gemmatimonas sp.]
MTTPGYSPAPLGPSNPQREQAIERLSRAFADDAITMDDFERRAELVYRAASVAELQQVVADLPALAEAAGAKGVKTMSAVMTLDRIRTFLGSTERRMPAIVPRQMAIRTTLGNTELDFRDSKFEAGITEVHVSCLLGNVELTVPAGVRVELLVSSVLANVESTGVPSLDDPPATGAVLRVIGRAVLANVEIHTGLSGGNLSLT